MRLSSNRFQWRLGAALACSLLSFGIGCRPPASTYSAPVVAVPDTWKGTVPQTAVAADPHLAQWWKELRDPQLDRLVERAVAGNLDLRAAAAAVREARARRGVAVADRMPTVNASGQAGFQRGSDRRGSAANVGLFRAGFDAGWEVDVFGGIERSIDQSEALLEASEEQLRDVLVTLLAEVALNYVEVRQYQAQLQVAEENLSLQLETLGQAEARWEAGLITRLDVDLANYQVSETRARIPSLRIRLEQAKLRLAVLLGLNPGDLGAELEEPAPVPVGPTELALGVPADLLRRRPDLRRAERIIAAQSAAVGVAEAALRPSFFLSGTIGYETITKGNPLSLGNLAGAAIGSVLQTVFDSGRLRQQLEVRTAIQEQALIDYEARILDALEDVESALVAYVEEQVRRESLIQAAEAATRATELVRRNYAAGLIDFLAVLESQRALLSLRDQLAQSNGAVTSHVVRLYKAVGGGWDPVVPAALPGAASPSGSTGNP